MDVKTLDLTATKGRIAALRAEVEEVFKGKDLHQITADEAAKIKTANDEMADLGEHYDGLMALAKGRRDADDLERRIQGATAPTAPGRKAAGRPVSVGHAFATSDVAKAYRETGLKGQEFEFGLKGFFTKGLLGEDDAATPDQEYDPEVTRLPGIVAGVVEQSNLIVPMFNSFPTDQWSIAFMKETTATNAAAEVGEGDAAAESALDFTPATSPVRKISTILPITDEVIADVPGLRAYVDGRLRLFAEQRLDGQLISGSGAGVNLTGIANLSGVQTQAKGADPTFDAIFKAMTKVSVTGGLEPDGIALHPNDWETIRLTRTADGIYILGNPGDQAVKRLFALPVTTSTRVTENTGIVGAFRTAADLRYRKQATLTISDSDGTNFQKDILTLKVSMRVAFVVYRDAGFCLVTGI